MGCAASNVSESRTNTKDRSGVTRKLDAPIILQARSAQATEYLILVSEGSYNCEKSF